ncbi:hypothetical protein [Kineosporia succinea]|uniref:2'-5' RNA ligase n=1 Tax=Kineosporia succinea TaxID=84632 RepID=A0ABT9PEA5_9ACTN|nr:hypothetical protein [Kineosporia succinea]MDP9831027.1 hypothetical protein [Kineosporia succinea]
MAHLTLDVVLLLPPLLRELAVQASDQAGESMESAFRLGHPHPAVPGAGVCEPHVSLFMLRLAEGRVGELMDEVAALATRTAPVPVVGQEWRPNPYGAPELHYRRSARWTALQDDVVASAEPLRDGLRESDPAGARPSRVIERLEREDPTSAQLRQLVRYGYDEIGERFRPHVTVAWPRRPAPGFSGRLPEASRWDGVLDRIAVFGMGPNGTCVRPFGDAALTGPLSTTANVDQALR